MNKKRATYKMHSTSIKKTLLVTALISLISACGGSDISSSSNSNTFGSQGATPFAGTWTLNARISLSITSNDSLSTSTTTTQSINQTSTVGVDSNGAAAINSTDSDCSINVNFNGSQINYQANCLIAIPAGSPCLIRFTAFAAIVGTSASGSFSPQVTQCNNAAVSYIGNLSGTQVPEPTI